MIIVVTLINNKSNRNNTNKNDSNGKSDRVLQCMVSPKLLNPLNPKP